MCSAVFIQGWGTSMERHYNYLLIKIVTIAIKIADNTYNAAIFTLHFNFLIFYVSNYSDCILGSEICQN